MKFRRKDIEPVAAGLGHGVLRDVRERMHDPMGALTFTKKPVTVEAMRWDGENEHEIAEWAGWEEVQIKTSNPPFLVVRTFEGTTLASVGDWIIKGTKGEFYPCKPDVMADVYETTQGTFVCDRCKKMLPSDEGCHGFTCHDCSGCSHP